MIDLLFANAEKVVTLRGGPPPRRKDAMNDLGEIERGFVGVDRGSRAISYVGAHEPGELADGCEIVDCAGKCILPGFVDAHTHLVFAGGRAGEFYMRAGGRTYLEIAAAGGGIRKSVESTRKASLDELIGAGQKNAWELLRQGTTTVEAKSGYGLDIESELKLLTAIREVGSISPLEVVPTFLGAHAIPQEYAAKRKEYVDMVCGPMLSEVAGRKLAEYADVFIEEGAFTLEEGERVIAAAKEYKLGIRIHADEFTNKNAAGLGVKYGAASVDHLGAIGEDGIRALAGSDTVAILMPSTIFFVGSDRYAPARALIDAGAAVALASDLNPGSSMVYGMPLVMTLAALKMRMTAGECVTAATINAAYSLGRAHRKGSIEPGKDADLIIVDAPDVSEIPYRMGADIVSDVLVGGRWVKRNHAMLWKLGQRWE